MTSKLGEYCRTQRIAKGLTLGQLAVQVGYRNLGKGTNRLHQFETTGEIHSELLGKIVQVLGLDAALIRQLIEQDHQEYLGEWNAWADEPIKPHMVIRLIPGVYQRRELPDDALTPDAAEQYALQFAKEHHWKICLVISRRMSV